MDVRIKMAHQEEEEERVSKNPHCCCKYKNQQRNSRFFRSYRDEKAHDGKVMPRLIEHVLKRKDNKDIKIKSVLGDGSYDSNENFKNLLKKRIMPCIKVRKNSIISSKNNKLRNREVINQTKDLLKWKKKKDMDRDGLLELFSLQ